MEYDQQKLILAVVHVLIEQCRIVSFISRYSKILGLLFDMRRIGVTIIIIYRKHWIQTEHIYFYSEARDFRLS